MFKKRKQKSPQKDMKFEREHGGGVWKELQERHNVEMIKMHCIHEGLKEYIKYIYLNVCK